jgi:hypothetical protein
MGMVGSFQQLDFDKRRCSFPESSTRYHGMAREDLSLGKTKLCRSAEVSSEDRSFITRTRLWA